MSLSKLFWSVDVTKDALHYLANLCVDGGNKTLSRRGVGKCRGAQVEYGDAWAIKTSVHRPNLTIGLSDKDPSS